MKKLIAWVSTLCILMGCMVLPASAAEPWLWPVADCYTIHSNFGLRDLYGTGSFDNTHGGIDVGSSGMAIRAAKSGTIYNGYNSYSDGTFIGGSMGNYTMINHGDGTYSVYMHMKPGNKISGSVKQGEVIGYIGKTGEAYGPHLHFEIYTNPNNRYGSRLNPMPTNSNITIINKYVLPSGWPATKTTYVFSSSHTCNKGTYVYYWDAHPHYSCYKCSICGKVWEDRSSSRYVEGCADCSTIRVTTKGAVEITDTTAGLPGSYYNPAAKTVTEYGAKYGPSKDNLCWNAPLPRNESYVNGGIPAYVVKGLTPGTTYYYRSYVVSGGKTYYGDIKSFLTKGIKVTTAGAKDITDTTAALPGSYYNPAVMTVTEYGAKYGPSKDNLCWTAPLPRNESYVSGGIPPYVIKGLNPGAIYYYKSYVVAGGTTYYGEVKSFTTTAPVVTPDSIKVTANVPQNITATSAALSGSYYNPDGLKILEYGARYGTSKNPDTYAGFITANKTDVNGSIPVCTAENLQPNTTYYYYTFVTTKQYMHCSEIKSFTTPSTGEVTPPTDEVHFPKVATYTQGQFTDVPASQWFTKNVAGAVEFGLMKGNSPTTFNPYGDVTLAEAITMAARIHSIYTTGSENFTQASGQAWYQVYLDYAYQNGIINYSYYTRDVKQRATRAEYAEIFANALPDIALYAKNTVADNVIPDVKMSDSYAGAVYKLYRAGILAGGDVKGTFSPLTYITRAESATIVSRMADSDNRMDFSL